MASTLNTYIDLNLSFIPHPITGDLTRVFDESSIKQSIKTLILTNHNDVPFSPWVGANLTSLMFEPVSPIIEDVIERAIRSTINQYEPRAIIEEIKIKYNEDINSYSVWMSFSIIGLDKPVTIDFLLERAR